MKSYSDINILPLPRGCRGRRRNVARFSRAVAAVLYPETASEKQARAAQPWAITSCRSPAIYTSFRIPIKPRDEQLLRSTLISNRKNSLCCTIAESEDSRVAKLGARRAHFVCSLQVSAHSPRKGQVMLLGLRRSLSLKVICFAKEPRQPAEFITTTIRVNAWRAGNTLIAIIDCSASGELRFTSSMKYDCWSTKDKDREKTDTVYSMLRVQNRS